MAFPLLGSPKPQFSDSNGVPFAAGTLDILDPDNDTAKANYPTANDADADTNGRTVTLTLDERGEPETGLFGRDGEDYKLVLKDSKGATIWAVDDIRVPIALPYLQTADEKTENVTPTDITKFPSPIRDISRHVDDNTGATDVTTGFQNALLVENSIIVPEGAYLISGQLTQRQGQEVAGAGRNLTILKVADAFNLILILMKQGCGVRDMTLTKTTGGTLSANGTAIQVDTGSNWNTSVSNVVIDSFNVGDNITNYRHKRSHIMYFFCNYGAVMSHDGVEASGTTLFDTCAFLDSGQIGLWCKSPTTHTQAKGCTFEKAQKHIVCDGLLYLDSCYISDLGAYNITGSGEVYVSTGYVAPFDASAVDNGSTWGLDFVNTDEEYCVNITRGTFDNTRFKLKFQLEGGSNKRGATFGPGKYVLNSCYLGNDNESNRWPYEVSSTIDQQILSSGKPIPNYIINGTFTDRDAAYTNMTNTGVKNAWGGAVKELSSGGQVDMPYVVPDDFTLGDDLLLMVFAGTGAAGEIGLVAANGLVVDGTKDTFVDGDVAVGTDRVTLTGHPFVNEQDVLISTTGTLPAGLSLATTYYVKKIDANTVEFYSDEALTSIIDITAAAGGGTHTIRRSIMQFSSEITSTAWRTIMGESYGGLSNVGMTALRVTVSQRSGSMRMSSFAGTSNIHAIVLTPIPDQKRGKPFGWFENPESVAYSQPTEVVTGTNVIMASESGKTFYLNIAGGFTSTLPPPALGLRYKFIVKTAPTTAYIITTDNGDNILQGTFLDIVGELVAIVAQDTLNFVASTSLVGDSLEVESDGVSWFCTAFSKADGGITVSV